MIYELTGLRGTRFEVDNPLSVHISMDEGAPADSISLKLPVDLTKIQEYSIYKEELRGIKVYDDQNNRLILNGIVDEQSIDIDENGAVLTIYARDIASLLVDNEALPQIYCVPSTDLIFRRHAKDYGFIGYKGNNRVFSDTFEVVKGMSEWQVIEEFSKNFLEVNPRVKSSGEIDFTGDANNNSLIFSNLQSGIFYTDISLKSKRCKPMSEVFVRLSKEGSYSSRIVDELSISMGIKRKRYINAVNDIKNPLLRCKSVMSRARDESFEIDLSCPGGIFLELFDKASVNDPVIGFVGALVVSGIDYNLNSSGEMCKITLRRNNR